MLNDSFVLRWPQDWRPTLPFDSSTAEWQETYQSIGATPLPLFMRHADAAIVNNKQQFWIDTLTV